jgi:hypothetical protein
MVDFGANLLEKYLIMGMFSGAIGQCIIYFV